MAKVKKKEKFQDLEKIQAELMSWSRRDIDRWERRNQRFKRDQELYQLTKPADITAYNRHDITILNDPKVLVKKLARLIGRHPNVIETPPSPNVDPIIAQKIENFAYLIDQGINQSWMLGLNNPYRYDQAFYTCLRGWPTARTLIRDLDDEELEDVRIDPSVLFDHQLFDPVHVYPFAAGGRVRRVTHYYTTTAGELRHDPLYADFLNADRDEDIEDGSIIHVTAVYWESDGTWYHGVLGGRGPSKSSDSMWIKEPVELGYNPWTIVLANGSSYRQTSWDDITYLSEIGTGALEDNADMYTYLNRMATRLSELLSLESNPPITAYVQNGQVKTLRFLPGSRNWLTPRDKLEVHKFGPQLGDFQLLWDLLNQRAARAGLPPAFFAEYSGESGFSASVLLAAGKDILFPFVEAINQADALKYRKFLELYRDFGPNKPLPTRLTPDGMGRALSAEITYEEIKQQGTYIQVTREDMAPQELAARVNTGLQMVRDKAISLETFRKDYAKVRNPAAENLKVLAEQVYLSEDVIRALIPLALTDSGQEQLRRVWEMTQNPMPPPGMEGAMPAGAQQNGLPPGAAPALPPGGLPGPMGAMPGVPPIPPGLSGPIPGAAPQQQLPPDLAAIMAMMAGGVPGMPGQPPALPAPGPIPFIPPGV